MRIQHNTSASVAIRSVLSQRGALIKSLEKLSSGYTVNRAADDAAGLAISEKMRRQITGLKQAHQNSKDGVTLIQIGEGALSEVHDMLNRALELADQSANGIYNDELDREALQRELDQLCADIDRISKSTNFNGIDLFQDEGLEYETPESYYAIFGKEQRAADVNRDSAQVSQDTQTTPQYSLDDLLRDEDKGKLNIVYLDSCFTTVQTGVTDANNGIVNDPTQDITIGGKKISDILKMEIVPQTVKNILDSYPAFGYLENSAIGIGMKLYNDPNSDVLASVGLRSSLYSSGTGSLGYMLSVNMGKVDPSNANWREDLEATIAHEMIHAFMDEATTAGMIGKLPAASGSTSLQTVNGFESWFVEGMAQTASGSNGWVSSTTASGLRIDTSSQDADIRAQIQTHMLKNDETATDVNYGTGYLACMYLGWKIASAGVPSTPVNASTISAGLSTLLNEVIGGSSLDAAIKKLTNNAFSDTAAFKSKFNGADSEITGFVHDLMVATNTGRGGLVSGDLSATDLTQNTSLTGVGLFALNTASPMINNSYPSGYVVLTGGTTSKDGVKPSDFTPAVANQKDYGDYVIKSNRPVDASGAIQGITWDSGTKTLTVTAGMDVEITMKAGATGAGQKLVIDGGTQVTLNGVTADSLTVKQDTDITCKSMNTITAVTVESGKNVGFQSSGQLKTTTFTNNGTVTFDGGATVVNNGRGTIGGTVIIDGAYVSSKITNPKAPDGTTTLLPAYMAVSGTGLTNIASISIDGKEAKGVLLSNATDKGYLWLDPAKDHHVVFTDASGTTSTMSVIYNPTTAKFGFTKAVQPFTLNSGLTRNVDYKYIDGGTTLVILTDKVTSISGGTFTNATGTLVKGRIQIADNIGAVNLEMDGVNCVDTSVAKAGIDLGSGNQVTLRLASGSVNTLLGGTDSASTTGCAGISLKSGTTLTIEGDDTAVLNTTGGFKSAGIGSDYDVTINNTSITINGGTINATSGNMGAGIGAGAHQSYSATSAIGFLGDIIINGGNITAKSMNEGAGIGGALGASIKNITITGGTINATSTSHGAGIGGGHNAYNGDITISGGNITAISNYHGTGIGAGCSSNTETRASKILITGNAVIEKAQGGDLGAGMGASWYGNWGDIEISGNAIVKSSTGGESGAGIGSGSQGRSWVGNITIDTTGSVSAKGGTNGVGIGSGHGNGSISTCGNIEIKQGTVTAMGDTNSTGIGAGRGSVSGNITIGDKDNPNNKVVVTAQGGMSYNGGNIMAYTDAAHTNAGKVVITGNGTTVRPGEVGEGLYSTSGVVNNSDPLIAKPLFAYPVYLFHTDGSTGINDTLDAGVGLNAAMNSGNKLPLNKDDIDLSTIKITSDKGETWNAGISHDPLDKDYVFVWLQGMDQELTIEYEENDAPGVKKSVKLNLIYYKDSGVFRIRGQKQPDVAQVPSYDPVKPKPPEQPDEPDLPDQPDPPDPPDQPDLPDPPDPPETKWGPGGIILQIGAEYGEILTVPQFYFSADALKLGDLDISTQENAWESVPVIQNAINRVSSIRGTYGAMQNRLEHNQQQLLYEVENTTDAESRIRDTDIAKEMMAYTKSNILLQSAQAMLAQANQVPQGVLQLLA